VLVDKKLPAVDMQKLNTKEQFSLKIEDKELPAVDMQKLNTKE
jgi:hypothetical protein